MKTLTVHFNQLKEVQQERLSLLLEECGEVIQAIGKIQRHGYESHNPLVPGSPSNREDLARELGHVLYVMQVMTGSGDISQTALDSSRREKAESIIPFLHHIKIAPAPTVQDRGVK